MALIGALLAKERIYTRSPPAANYQKGGHSNIYKKGDSKQSSKYTKLINKKFLCDKLGFGSLL